MQITRAVWSQANGAAKLSLVTSEGIAKLGLVTSEGRCLKTGENRTVSAFACHQFCLLISSGYFASSCEANAKVPIRLLFEKLI